MNYSVSVHSCVILLYQYNPLYFDFVTCCNFIFFVSSPELKAQVNLLIICFLLSINVQTLLFRLFLHYLSRPISTKLGPKKRLRESHFSLSLFILIAECKEAVKYLKMQSSCKISNNAK